MKESVKTNKKKTQNPLIAVKNLSIAFRKGEQLTPAVKDMSYAIFPREIVGIVGESGSGKSVSMLGTLNLLPAHAQREVESIVWNQEEIKEYSNRQMRKIWGAGIAYIYQEPSQSYDPLQNIFSTFKEYFRAHKESMSIDEIEKRVELLLAEVGIYNPRERMYNYFHQFSGGMIQRVQIALALALNPKLLIADEPTTALDVTTQKQVVELLLRLCKERNMSMVFISHDLPLIASLVDRVLVMKDGQLVEGGKTTRVIDEPRHSYTKHLLSQTIKFGERYNAKR